ncbi:MAG: hypothetical protein IJ960_07020 [Oscillospiraceae bacterium]|nr:hypothetical protein [Oscillospiraceae bacterium]
MTEQQKKMKKYCNAVERRLNLPRDVRTRVMNDFASSIAARREAGETDEAIFAELGTPREAAAVLNEQMKEYAYRKSPWRWAALAAVILGGLMIAYNGLVGLLTHALNAAINSNSSVGIIGGADGPVAIFVTSNPSVEGLLVWLLVLATGLIGWWYFSHMRE